MQGKVELNIGTIKIYLVTIPTLLLHDGIITCTRLDKRTRDGQEMDGFNSGQNNLFFLNLPSK